MAENQSNAVQPKRGVSPVTVVAVFVFLGVLVLGAYTYYERYGKLPIPEPRQSETPTTPREGGDTARHSPLDALRDEQVFLDETVVVSAGGSQMRGFRLPSDRPVRVIAEGVRDTAKGFTVYCMTPADWKVMQSGKRFEYFTALSAPKIQKFDHTARLAAGEYCIVVSNTENMLNSMQVHLRIVIDPK